LSQEHRMAGQSCIRRSSDCSSGMYGHANVIRGSTFGKRGKKGNPFTWELSSVQPDCISHLHRWLKNARLVFSTNVHMLSLMGALNTIIHTICFCTGWLNRWPVLNMSP